jgi:hypothetical protein
LEWSFCAIGAQRDSRVIGKGLRGAGGESAACRLARAKARAARLEGTATPEHQWQPPPAPPPAEQLAADNYRRHAAAMTWLTWW